MGSRSKVSEILNKRRPLTLSMIRKLHKNLNISSGYFNSRNPQEESMT
ncbi:hypothetical protein [Rickettsia asembonensis]|nr:hypothetical protein [Rickettsia asembonensis]